MPINVHRRLRGLFYPAGVEANVRRTTLIDIPTQVLELKLPGKSDFEPYVIIELVGGGKVKYAFADRNDFNLFLKGFPGEGDVVLEELKEVCIVQGDRRLEIRFV